MELADRYYEDSLERSLLAASFTPEEEEGRRPRYHHHLLGTIGPTRVDALLFAHLAEARNDVHLPRVLSCRPLLKRYLLRGDVRCVLRGWIRRRVEDAQSQGWTTDGYAGTTSPTRSIHSTTEFWRSVATSKSSGVTNSPRPPMPFQKSSSGIRRGGGLARLTSNSSIHRSVSSLQLLGLGPVPPYVAGVGADVGRAAARDRCFDAFDNGRDAADPAKQRQRQRQRQQCEW